MNREEAIRRIKAWNLDADDLEVLSILIPELRESEDEEIRKDIIGGLMWQRDNLKSEGPHDNNLILPGFCLTVGEHLKYLEKQKEPTKEELYAEAGTTEKEYIANTMKMVRAMREKKQEQKPNSTEDMPYIADERFYEREPADSFKYKLAEYMTKCCTKKEGPYGYSYSINSESILQMAKEELIKSGELKETKPVESSTNLDELMDDYFANFKVPEHQIIFEDTFRKIAKDFYEMGRNSKPVEWSEKHIADIFEKVGLAKIAREQGNDKLTNALQDAMLELSKVENAEWSEEDEHRRQQAINALDRNGYYVLVDWLKSLRPQKKKDLPPGFYFITPDGKKYYSKEFRYGDMKMKVVENEKKEG